MKWTSVNTLIPFISFLLVISMFACKKDESVQEDEYFVKYIIESQTIYLGVQLNTVVSDEKNMFKSLLINTGKWETTIGPVKKGFQATLQTTKKRVDR